jgi:hypothetical protein
MTDALLPSRFLFRFAVPLVERTPVWAAKGSTLEEKYRLLSFNELEGGTTWADVRGAWSSEGLAFSVVVRGKHQPLWCRASRVEDSDSVQLWIDTRDVHNIHRAGRFCHSFLFLPAGGGSRQEDPMALMVSINRAREQPRPVGAGQLRTRCQKRSDGYTLDVFIAAEAMTGFDPQEHPRLGFTYAVIDRELGQQTFSVGSPLPFQEDPSLWATLELKPA